MRLRPPITAVLALLGGCAAVPTVVYHQVAPGVRGDTWVPFRLTDSIVVIGAPGAAHGDDSAAPPVDLAHHVVYCPRERVRARRGGGGADRRHDALRAGAAHAPVRQHHGGPGLLQQFAAAEDAHDRSQGPPARGDQCDRHDRGNGGEGGQRQPVELRSRPPGCRS